MILILFKGVFKRISPKLQQLSPILKKLYKKP